MGYIVSGTTKSAGLGAMSKPAPDAQEALRKAQQMINDGMVGVSIQDNAGHKTAMRLPNREGGPGRLDSSGDGNWPQRENQLVYLLV
jgi:hypothetical protein